MWPQNDRLITNKCLLSVFYSVVMVISLRVKLSWMVNIMKWLCLKIFKVVATLNQQKVLLGNLCSSSFYGSYLFLLYCNSIWCIELMFYRFWLRYTTEVNLCFHVKILWMWISRSNNKISILTFVNRFYSNFCRFLMLLQCFL